MSLKSGWGGGKGMNGPKNSKPAGNATKAGWSRAGTGKGPKLKGK